MMKNTFQEQITETKQTAETGRTGITGVKIAAPEYEQHAKEEQI